MGLVCIITNSKGGPGKSTTTANLAFVANARGYRTAVIDADTQQHAAQWVQVAAADIDTIDVSRLVANEAKRFVEDAANEFELVLIDTPGHTKDPGLVSTLTLCSDLAIVPLEPSEMDARELPEAYQFIEVSRAVRGAPDPFIVFSKTSETDVDAREFVEEARAAGYQVAEARITRLRQIRKAALNKDLMQMKGREARRVASLYEKLFDELIAPRLPVLQSYGDSPRAHVEPDIRRRVNE